MCKEATCTVGEATIPENHEFVTDGIPVTLLPKHMLVFAKDLKSKEHNGQWGVLETYNLQKLIFQIFILKTEAEVWIKPENISIATDGDKEMTPRGRSAVKWQLTASKKAAYLDEGSNQ